MKHIKTIRPMQCHLFRHDVTIEEASLSLMDRLKEYPEMITMDENECIRVLSRCKQCEQLYFYEFLEWIDWEKGDDPQYRNFYPVETEEDADKLNELNALELAQIRPQLRHAWPPRAPQTIRWVV